MNSAESFALYTFWGAIWGVLWALLLYSRPWMADNKRPGRFRAAMIYVASQFYWLRLYRTWVTVVVGVGVCVLIFGALYSWHAALAFFCILAGAGTPIIVAAINEEFRRDAS